MNDRTALYNCMTMTHWGYHVLSERSKTLLFLVVEDVNRNPCRSVYWLVIKERGRISPSDDLVIISSGMAALFLIAKVLLLPDATFSAIRSTNKCLETQTWEKTAGEEITLIWATLQTDGQYLEKCESVCPERALLGTIHAVNNNATLHYKLDPNSAVYLLGFILKCDELIFKSYNIKTNTNIVWSYVDSVIQIVWADLRCMWNNGILVFVYIIIVYIL